MSGAIVFRGKKYAHNRWILAAVGYLAIQLIVGPVLVTASVFLAPAGQVQSVLAIYAAGVSFNAIHASAVALLMLIAGPALLYKVERIQKKYGMMEADHAV